MSLTRLLAHAAPSGLPVARAVVRSGIGRAFGGPPPFDVAADPGDAGLYGPGSASWQVMGEPAAIVGGVRALVVQALHPLAVAGVVGHSGYRDDPLGRLRRTSAYVTATTFGSTPQALRAARTVRAVHEQVVGTAPDGRPYRASDPRLLAWVSVAFTSSLLATDRAYAPAPVDRALADAFVEEQAFAAALLDPRVDLDQVARVGARGLREGRVALPLLDAGLLPRSVAEVETVLASYAGELAVGTQGRETLRFLLWPALPASIRSGYLPVLAGALATLDPDQRALVGFPRSTALTRPVVLQTRTLLTLLRLTSGRSPTFEAATRRAAARDRLAA